MPLLALFAGLLATAGAAWHLERSYAARERERFARGAIQAGAAITQELRACLAMLDATTGLFIASEFVSDVEFRRFVDQLNLSGQYPGVATISYVEWRAGRQAAGLRRWDNAIDPEALLLTYTEPAGPMNDPLEIDAVRIALARAIDRGVPASVPMPQLRQGGHKAPDLCLIVPLYDGARTPPTEAERRATIRGFILARLRCEAFFEAALADVEAPPEFSLWDASDRPRGRRIHQSAGFRNADTAGLSRLETLEPGGLLWKANFQPGEAFFRANAGNVTGIVVGSGLIITGLLFWLARSQTLAADRAEADAAALRASQSDLAESEARKSAILESALDAIITMDHHGRVIEWNATAERMFGRTRHEAVGAALAELIIVEPQREACRAAVRRYAESAASGAPVGRRFETEALRADGSSFPVEVSISRIGVHRPPRFTGFIRDITERARADRQRRLMTRELDHRVKNNLFAVMAILTESARRTDSVPALVESVSGRLHALARLHELLANHAWESADLRDLLNVTLAPYREGAGRDADGAPERVELDGPSVILPARVASTLCIALHELATNAAKYGSLSNGQGRVRIAWRTERGERGAERLILTWRESGGPPVAAPGRRGFGSELIEGGVRYETGGECRIRFEPGGVVCDIVAPLTGAARHEPNESSDRAREDAQLGAGPAGHVRDGA